MATANSISKFENSLKEFLINVMSDKYGDAKSYSYRYNNLKVFMDPRRCSDAHFFVSIGISEACFSITDGKKLDGGLGAEDAYVKRWSDRVNINSELKAHWKIIMEAIAADQEDDLTKKSSASLRLRRSESSKQDLDVDMTGTGIDKSKREKQQKHLLRMKAKVLESRKNSDNIK